MNTDNLEPAKKKKVLRNLEMMSIEALGAYIEELEEEIARALTEIEVKQTARQNAERAFKK